MTNPIDSSSPPNESASPKSVEVPQATAWPVVLALGIALFGVGFVTNPVFLIVGVVLFAFGLGGWIRQLLPGYGHIHEPLVEPALRPRPITEKPGTVGQLLPGMAGYRFQLPLKVHPISAGIKGGIIGGLAMPVPALAYGLLSRHGVWFPINLLAGIVVPGISGVTEAELERFHLGAIFLAIFLHATLSITFGLLFGVVSPTLPPLPGAPVIAGGILMPLLWTGFCYGFMGIINPLMQTHVNWPWFIVSQLVYGLVMSFVVIQIQKVPVPPVGSGPCAPAGSAESNLGGVQP
jgi:hypothetical protein